MHAKHQNKNKRTWKKFYEVYHQKIPNTVIANKKKTAQCTVLVSKKNLVYYAAISCNNKNYKPKLCKGSCETILKKATVTEKKSFNVPLYKHNTKLSTEY